MKEDPEPIQSIRLTDAGNAFRRGLIDAQHLALLPLPGHDDGTSISVVRLRDLESLLQSVPAGLIVDRGKKHPAKPLSHYLTGHAGLLAIRAHYHDVGQAVRGMRALMNTAAQFKAHAAFFIGVSDAIFDALTLRAGPEQQPGETQEDDAAWLNSLVGGSIVVPDSLRKAYLGHGDRVDWVRRSIVLAARTDHTVLIQGETGTGKDVVARQIHDLSPRGTERFVHVNCGGIPAELFESEVFGHVRGSFTGATRDKRGFWTLADRGTLFLDEIGDLTLPHQVKVLRALEDGHYSPVGSEHEIHSRARVIAATNRDLAGMVRTGQFREDLYYRLFTFRIRTPALREHPGDIPVLARHFWAKLGDGAAVPLTHAVTDALRHYQWPGNARELRAFLINLLLMANGHRVDLALMRAVMRERLGEAVQRGKTL